MQKFVYEDYKYSMQDTTTLYIGAKYSFQEILDEESISFKYRLIVERYILPECDLEDTLESHLYYLDSKSFLVKIYHQLKARVKINVLTEKKDFHGNIRKEYTTKIIKLDKLVEMSVKEKEAQGVVIQELLMNKLALLAF